MDRGPKVRLTAERLRRGWTQNELARRSGLGQPTISLIESQRLTNPWATQLAKLAKAFDWPLEDAERLLELVEVEIQVAEVTRDL